MRAKERVASGLQKVMHPLWRSLDFLMCSADAVPMERERGGLQRGNSSPLISKTA